MTTDNQARTRAIKGSIELFVPTVTKLVDAAMAQKSVRLDLTEVNCLAVYFMVEMENRTKGRGKP